MLIINNPQKYMSICQNSQWIMSVLYWRFPRAGHLSRRTLTSLSHKMRSVQVRFAPIWPCKWLSRSWESTFVTVETASCKCLKLQHFGKRRETQRYLRGIIKMFPFHKRGPTLSFESLKWTVYPRNLKDIYFSSSSIQLDSFGGTGRLLWPFTQKIVDWKKEQQ